MLECVVNISEGRDAAVLRQLADAAGGDLLDLHTDPHHHRSVLTLVGETAPRAVATTAVGSIDLGQHVGVHPRLGVVDVVPFAALSGSNHADAVRARDDFARWFADTHQVPCFRYGPERSLPEVRRHAFHDLPPDFGPPRPHPTAGAAALGARPILVAYNLWVEGLSLSQARSVAQAVRQPGLRALGLELGDARQVSMNLTEPARVGPDTAYDLVDGEVRSREGRVVRAELVGLLPAAVLHGIDDSRWTQLDLSDERTIEARLRRAGLT